MEISTSQVQFLRLRGQRLHPQSTSVVDIVKAVCGLQAQEVEAGMLSIGVRGQGITANDITRSWLEERSIVRTWAMRGTLHFVAMDDLAWMLPLFGPVFIRSSQRRRLDLGLDEETGKRGVGLLRDLLGERGPLTKAEVAKNLSEKGIPMKGQTSFHLIRLAALQGWVCFGPLRGKKDTFVLVEDWLGRKLDIPTEHGIEELARRYLAAYAPTTVEDFASWSGLSIRDCREAWAQLQVIDVQIGNSTAWMLEDQLQWLDATEDHETIVHLLPRFDTYLLGYADRSLIIDPVNAKRIYPGGGMIHPTVLVDGKAVGKWKTVRKRERGKVELEPFVELSPEVRESIKIESKAVSQFFNH